VDPSSDRQIDGQTHGWTPYRYIEPAVHTVSPQLSDTIVRFLILLMYAGCFHSVYYEVNMHMCLQCFDTVGWAAGRAFGL